MTNANEVKTFNASGRRIYEDSFLTANDAYREYCDIVNNLKMHLPKGYRITVVRYSDGEIMHFETIDGTL